MKCGKFCHLLFLMYLLTHVLWFLQQKLQHYEGHRRIYAPETGQPSDQFVALQQTYYWKPRGETLLLFVNVNVKIRFIDIYSVHHSVCKLNSSWYFQIQRELNSWGLKFSEELVECKARRISPQNVVLGAGVKYGEGMGDWAFKMRSIFNLLLNFLSKVIRRIWVHF